MALLIAIRKSAACKPRFEQLPVVTVQAGSPWQGYGCRVTTLLEFAPDKPLEPVIVPLHYSDAGAVPPRKPAIEITGRMRRILAGRSFDVACSGSKHFMQRYLRRTNRHVLADRRETRMPTC